MCFIIQCKTNWKFLLIVVVLAVIVGGGILYYWDSVRKEIFSVIQQVPQIQRNTKDETANWQTYRNEEYGFGFDYPAEWDVITLDSQRNEGVYALNSSNKKIVKIYYFKLQDTLVFIDKGREYLACKEPYTEENKYEEILRVIYPGKEVKTVYSTYIDIKDISDCLVTGRIEVIDLSPNRKYISFLKLSWEWGRSFLINLENGSEILGGGIIYDYKDIFWSSNSKILVMTQHYDSGYGGGENAIYVSDYGEIEKLNKVLTFGHTEDYSFFDIKFLDNEKLFFSTLFKKYESEKGTYLAEVRKYEYNVITKELKEIK